MKESITWLILWCKRLLKKPLLLFTILLMPLTVLFLQYGNTKKDAVLQVAIYLEDKEDTSGRRLAEHIVSLSDSTIYFYLCKDKEGLIQEVKSQRAACGYVIPGDLDKKLVSYVQKRRPFLTVIREKDNMTTRIVDEIVLSKHYPAIAYYILENFLEQQTGTVPDKEQLSRTFHSYYSNELLFQFQYLSGEENAILQKKNTSILMLPVRGIMAVLLLLLCMAGELVSFSDRKEGRTHQMSQKQRILADLYSLLIPGAAACVFALLSIKMAGISGSPLREIPAMVCYLLACMGLANLLGKLLPNKYIYLAAMPLMLLLSLILSPIFIDLSSILPTAGRMGRLLPATWYLKSIQSPENLIILLAYGAICLLAAKLFSLITNFH